MASTPSDSVNIHSRINKGGYESFTYIVKAKELSFTIRNSHIEKLGINETQLYEDSLKNIRPEPIRRIADVLYKDLPKANRIGSAMIGGSVLDSMYVISDNDIFSGANRILLTDYLKQVSEQLDEDYYVFLPETAFAVIVPVSKSNMDKKEIKTINRTISRRFNSSGSFLTDDTYIYKKSIGMLEKVKDDRLPTRAMLRR